LQSHLKEIQAQGLGIVSISYDSAEIVTAFSKQHGITFPMLSDAGSETIKRYGILNPLVEQASGPNRDDPVLKADVDKYVAVASFGVKPFMAGMALPGTFVVDRQGRVTSRFFEDFYFDRNTVSSLLIKLGGKGDASVAATKVSTNHLDVTTYPSDAAVALGNRFSLVMDVAPHTGLHVYAPGAEKSGYRVIAFKLDPHPQIQVFPVRYPASQIYYFKPLQERVPVFQRPFQLVQEVLLDGAPASQQALRGKEELTLTGSLEYQACDERICYNPVSVPLSWKLTLRKFVFERPPVGH